MKQPQQHTFSRVLALLLTFCLLTACDKLPDNGDLDGMWQLLSITTPDGDTQDVKDAQLYWSIRLRLVQYTSNRSANGNIFYSHFKEDGNTLILTDFCKNANYETETDDNEWITPEEATLLHPWGIFPTADPASPNQVTASFRIVHLSPSFLTLSSDKGQLTFRKF